MQTVTRPHACRSASIRSTSNGRLPCATAETPPPTFPASPPGERPSPTTSALALRRCAGRSQTVSLPTSKRGEVSVLIDAATPEFFATVRGVGTKPAWFELYGIDASGRRAVEVCFEIRARMTLDPDPIVDSATPDTVATKAYTKVAISGAIVESGLVTGSGARQIASAVIASGGFVDVSGARTAASNVIASGGYTKSSTASTIAAGIVDSKLTEYPTSSGARQIASAVVASGGYVNSADARLIAEDVVSSAGGQVRSTVEVLNWTSTSGYIPVLSGGTCYNFLQPISALRIDAVPRSLEDATILCHFSGGTNFLYPPDLGEIGDVEVSSGFYRIAVNTKQLIAAPVSYTGSLGVAYRSNGAVYSSAWVADAPALESGRVLTVYNGGAARSVGLIASGAALTVSGGYVSGVAVGSGADLNAVGGTILDATVAAGGSLAGFRLDEARSWSVIEGGSAGISSDTAIIGGRMHVYSGGVVTVSGEVSERVTIHSGAELALYGLGGTVADVVVSSGGSFNIVEPEEEDFDPIGFSVVAGSETCIAAGTLYYGGSAFAGECSGGKFSGLSGTYRIGIGSGVSAVSPVVGNSDTGKARIYAFSGARISSAHIGIGGDINLYSGAVASSTTLGGYSGERYQCELTVWGGSASGVIVSSNGYLNCISGGSVTGTATVMSGGSVRFFREASGATVALQSGAQCRISGAAVVNTLNISGGTGWAAGGASVGTAILSGTTTAQRPSLYVSSATVGSVVLSKMGALTTSRGAVVTSLEQKGGYVIGKGGTISDVRIEGSDFQVSSGTTVTDIVAIVGNGVTPKKKISIFNGGVVSNLTVEDIKDGIDSVTNQYGIISVFSGGRLFNTEFTNIVVSNGGVVNGITPKAISDGTDGFFYAGSLHIYSGGTALNVTSADGWDVVVDEGGCITYVGE